MSMFTNYVSLLSIRGSLARSVPVSGTMSPSPGLLLVLALCCAAAAPSAGGGQVEAVLQPTLVEAPVSLDTGSSKVTATCHVIRSLVSRVTPTIFRTDVPQPRHNHSWRSSSEGMVSLSIYIDIYKIYNIYHIYNICVSTIAPADY